MAMQWTRDFTTGPKGALVATGRWEVFVCRLVVQAGKPKLLQVVGAAHSASGLAGRLDSWQQETDKNSDNRNHYQEFDERKSSFDGPRHGKLLKIWDSRHSAGPRRKRQKKTHPPYITVKPVSFSAMKTEYSVKPVS